MSAIAKFLSVIILISFSASGQILIKKGVLGLDLTGVSRILQNYWLWGGIIFLALTFLLYLLILSRVQLNIIYPAMVSGTIIFVTIASRLFFNEVLSWPQILGVLIIIFGIFLMFFKKADPALPR